MTEKYRHLHPVWVKAALLGSLWGSVEIIIGSFLHNLRVPFTGTILSAIGISILIGGQKLWNEKGLVWRAGVVCALMKSISPSAVIIGPMVGILTEAFALELFVRISKGARIGLLLGGMITACLPFIQSIVSLIITYGFNIAVLYIEAYKIAAKNVGIHSLDAYDVIGIFLTVNALFGLGAVLLGIAVGKNAVKDTLDPAPESNEKYSAWTSEGTQLFSVTVLILTIIIIPLILYAISALSLVWSFALVALYIISMMVFYPKAWKRFSKPKLWIELIVITIFAGLLLGEMSGGSSGGMWGGISIGLQMSVRAAFMVVAFTIIGIELRNPIIIDWIMKKGFGQIGTAMEMAFDALPTMVASLGNQRMLLRHPVISLSRMLSVANHRLKELNHDGISTVRIYFLTGNRGSGKTKLLLRLVEEFKNRNIPVSGILSLAVIIDSVRIGYDVADIQTGKTVPLCRTDVEREGSRIGNFTFLHEGLEFGNRVLEKSNIIDASFVIVDEVGPLELKEEGWTISLNRLMAEKISHLLIVVRESLIERVKERWKIQPETVWNLNSVNSEELFLEIINKIGNNNN